MSWGHQYLPGVSFGQADVSANTDGTGSLRTREHPAAALWCDVLPAAAPNGEQRLRLVGRWLIDSQSSERFSVAHAIAR